jgi:hypothetical protein
MDEKLIKALLDAPACPKCADADYGSAIFGLDVCPDCKKNMVHAIRDFLMSLPPEIKTIEDFVIRIS